MVFVLNAFFIIFLEFPWTTRILSAFLFTTWISIFQLYFYLIWNYFQNWENVFVFNWWYHQILFNKDIYKWQWWFSKYWYISFWSGFFHSIKTFFVWLVILQRYITLWDKIQNKAKRSKKKRNFRRDWGSNLGHLPRVN